MFGLFQKSAFGLDISDTSLEMVEFQKKGGKVVLSAVGRMILTKGVIEDGKIMDEAKLNEILIRFVTIVVNLNSGRRLGMKKILLLAVVAVMFIASPVMATPSRGCAATSLTRTLPDGTR